MKTSLKFLILTGMCIAFIWACSSNDDTAQMVDDDVSISDDVDPTDDNPTDDDGGGMQGASDGQIIFPEGTDIDLTGATVTIAGEIIPVADTETMELPTFEGASELAFLTNAEGDILLAGFIDENRNQLSLASTATVLFYFATTGYLQAEEFKNEILTGIEESEEYNVLVNELETLFLTDNLVLKNLGFIDALETSISGFKSVDIVNNAIFLESNDIRSKMQLEKAEGGKNSFTISNRGARRAELFVYKKAFTDMDGNRTVLIDEVAQSQLAEFRDTISQGRYTSKNFPESTPVNSGNRIHTVVVCGTVFAETTTSPQELGLDDNESSAEFEVTVIGPGQDENGRNMTTAERQALERMASETFLLDYALPTLFEIAGRKDIYDEVGKEIQEEELLPLITTYFNNNSNVRELVFEGEFNAGLQLFFENIRMNGEVFQLLEQAYEIAFNNSDLSGSVVFTDTLSDNLASMTEIIIAVTSRFSFFCTDDQFDDISTLESWEVTADRGDVTLEPLRGGVQTLENLEITAVVEGFEEEELSDGSITYEWTVSENFKSVLRDGQGNRGITFTNTTNTVIFQSRAAGVDLVGFENLETVTVRAFSNTNGSSVLIGAAEMTVNVQERKFVIDPIDVVLCGIEQANFRVLNEEDKTPLAVNDDFDFRLVWTTSGAHALFNGNSTSETIVNENGILLRNLDDEVQNATQTVRVGIWLRPKDNLDDIPFREAGFAFADVFISNNNTIEFEIGPEGFIAFSAPDPPGTRLVLGGGFLIPRDERAIRYEAEIIEYYFDGELREGLSGRIFTWTNEAQAEPVFETDNINNTFGIVFNSASVNTEFPGFDAIKAAYDGVFGRAKITITLDK
ncbi:MAG: hypothetical protein AAF039_16990 [Bacteroidota bacterium]